MEIVQRFKERYESLAGHVHQVSRLSEVPEVLSAILRESGVKRAALAELPAELCKLVERSCAGEGIQVVKSPFESASLPHAIDAVQVGITIAEFAIADTGTLVEVTTDDAVRLVSALPRMHVCLVRTEDLVLTLEAAAHKLRKIYGNHGENCTVTLISGPSRTADIELKLTLGVHGPEVSEVIILP